MTLKFLWFKLLSKIRGVGLVNSAVDHDSKIEAGTVFVNSSMGRFSYCGYDCYLINSQIGSFCSISDCVSIGGGGHPLEWVSTSPAFYKGRDSISKRLAKLEFNYHDPKTIIGNDVWIGRGVYIKSGITIGDGAVIGMGSVVTKDVEPYSIVVGNPAVVIKHRFDTETIQKLQEIKWWEWEDSELQDKADKFSSVENFINAIRK